MTPAPSWGLVPATHVLAALRFPKTWVAAPSAAMTAEGVSEAGGSVMLCSHFVLDNDPMSGYTLAQDLPLTRGALARRRSVEAGTVPWQASHAGRWEAQDAGR